LVAHRADRTCPSQCPHNTRNLEGGRRATAPSHSVHSGGLSVPLRFAISPTTAAGSRAMPDAAHLPERAWSVARANYPYVRFRDPPVPPPRGRSAPVREDREGRPSATLLTTSTTRSGSARLEATLEVTRRPPPIGPTHFRSAGRTESTSPVVEPVDCVDRAAYRRLMRDNEIRFLPEATATHVDRLAHLPCRRPAERLVLGPCHRRCRCGGAISCQVGRFFHGFQGPYALSATYVGRPA
jgi:hypothetical protein